MKQQKPATRKNAVRAPRRRAEKHPGVFEVMDVHQYHRTSGDPVPYERQKHPGVFEVMDVYRRHRTAEESAMPFLHRPGGREPAAAYRRYRTTNAPARKT